MDVDINAMMSCLRNIHFMTKKKKKETNLAKDSSIEMLLVFAIADKTQFVAVEWNLINFNKKPTSDKSRTNVHKEISVPAHASDSLSQMTSWEAIVVCPCDDHHYGHNGTVLYSLYHLLLHPEDTLLSNFIDFLLKRRENTKICWFKTLKGN